MALCKKITLLFFLFSFLQAQEVNIIPLSDVMKQHPEIEYLKCHDAEPFEFEPFPVTAYPERHLHKGLFAETFVLKVPQGRVCSSYGAVTIADNFIKELFPQNHTLSDYETMFQPIVSHMSQAEPTKVPGRVVVLARKDMDFYFHWLVEMLSSLELLRLKEIEYDWIYVPWHFPSMPSFTYVAQTLQLLGIDRSKIIEPYNDHFYIQADELIVPSLTVRRVVGVNDDHFLQHPGVVVCMRKWTVDFLKKNFLSKAKEEPVNPDWSDKIFISRNKAGWRRVLNEDQVFALFEKQGFKRYFLEDMSVLQQIKLFNQAKVIVGAHGSGFTNIVFCEQSTKIIEIFQKRYDSATWNTAQMIGLQYDYIKTEQDVGDERSMESTYVSLEIIQDYINKYL